MSANTISTAVAKNTSPPAPPQPKLKTSCDFCSLSKVRCESQKPVCSRCAKLGHSCCYSVARRVGRRTRHSNRRVQAGISSESPAEPSFQLPRARQASDREAHRQNPRPYVELAQRSGSMPSLAPRGSPPAAAKLWPSNGATTFMSSSHDLTNPATQAGDDILQGGFSTTTLPAASVDHVWRDSESPDYPTTSSSSSASCAGQSSGGSMTSVTDSGSLVAMEEAVDCMDCMGVLMALQEQLVTANEDLRAVSGDVRYNAAFMRSAIAAVRIVDVAYDQVSTVLICPCSGPDRMDVGLMVATVCNSVLDLYSVIIGNSATSPEVTGASCSSAEEGFGGDAFQQWTFRDAARDAHERHPSSMQLGWDDSPAGAPMLVCVIEELPKMASLVLQFAKRYRPTSGPYDEAISGRSDLLYGLASYVRTRLHNVKNEATGQLQRTPVPGLSLMGNF